MNKNKIINTVGSLVIAYYGIRITCTVLDVLLYRKPIKQDSEWKA